MATTIILVAILFIFLGVFLNEVKHHDKDERLKRVLLEAREVCHKMIYRPECQLFDKEAKACPLKHDTNRWPIDDWEDEQ